MSESSEMYIPFQDYLESQPGAVILFVLINFRGTEMSRQIVSLDDVVVSEIGKLRAKFIVGELLAAKLVPGSYWLYLYVGLPKEEAVADGRPLQPADYTFNKCLTEQGIKILIRGGTGAPDITSIARDGQHNPDAPHIANIRGFRSDNG